MSTLYPQSDKSLGFHPMMSPEDLVEHREGVLKWVWLAGMLFAISFFIPAVEASTPSGVAQVTGWKLAYVAHSAAWYLPQMDPQFARRTHPLTPMQAWAVALLAVSAMWTLVFSSVVAVSSGHAFRPKQWNYWALVFALFAFGAAMVSTLVWFKTRGATPLLGSLLWNLSPGVLAFGLWRTYRQG